MYYQLTHVDGQPLPVALGSPTPRTLLRAGLLLEPQNLGQGSGGYGMLSLHWRHEPGYRGGYLAGIAEAYWLRPDGDFLMGRDGALDRCALRGTLANGQLELRLTFPDHPEMEGVGFRFLEAGDQPIPDRWLDVLYFGPGSIGGPPPTSVPERLWLFCGRAYLLACIPYRRWQARRRLRVAWRAPA